MIGSPIALLSNMTAASKSLLTIIAWASVLLAVAIGFDFQTPAKRFHDLDARIAHNDTAVTLRLAAHDSTLSHLEAVQAENRVMVEALIRLSCYKEPVSLISLAGLPCGRLLLGQHVRPGSSAP